MDEKRMMHKGNVIDKCKEYDVLNCETCGFVHINPIPTQEELNRIYRDEYYAEEKPLFIQHQMEDIEWWHIVYDSRYDFFEETLPKDRRRILDIGCGPGLFLKRGEERGWKGIGVEPSRQAAEYAKSLGLNILNQFLNETGLEENRGTFDVIHISEVLEHIPDPAGLCKKAYNLLDEDGILCVTVPNDYNPIQKLLREKLEFKPYWLAPPHHINYFDFNSLKGLLQQIGLEIVYSTAMFPMEFFLLMGDNYVGNDKVGRLCHKKRKRLDTILNESLLCGFKEDMYKLMAKHGIGREVVVYSIKQ